MPAGRPAPRRAQAPCHIVRHRHLRALPAGDDDQVGLLQQLGAPVRCHAQPAVGAQRTGLDGSAGKAIPAGAHLGARQAEDLGSDGELEGAQAVVNRRHHQRAGRADDWRNFCLQWHVRQL
jgi:hypothetical protein